MWFEYNHQIFFFSLLIFHITKKNYKEGGINSLNLLVIA